MLTIHLDNNQTDLVHTALEQFASSVRKSLKDGTTAPVKEMVDPQLFQIDLLITWFDRQKELRSEREEVRHGFFSCAADVSRCEEAV